MHRASHHFLGEEKLLGDKGDILGTAAYVTVKTVLGRFYHFLGGGAQYKFGDNSYPRPAALFETT